MEDLITQALDGQRATAREISLAIGIGAGRLYPVLFRMEQSGTIQSKWVDGPEPRRRVYFLPGMAV